MDIGDSVTQIGSRAFKGCYNLTSVTIPNSVSIGERAFDDYDSSTLAKLTEDHTAVSESAATALNIYAHDRNIVVENAAEEIRVYDAMGRLVGRDVARNVCTITINNSGVYIVKTGNVVKQVMVN